MSDRGGHERPVGGLIYITPPAAVRQSQALARSLRCVPPGHSAGESPCVASERELGVSNVPLLSAHPPLCPGQQWQRKASPAALGLAEASGWQPIPAAAVIPMFSGRDNCTRPQQR